MYFEGLLEQCGLCDLVGALTLKAGVWSCRQVVIAAGVIQLTACSWLQDQPAWSACC
jgi:hypothetical protein